MRVIILGILSGVMGGLLFAADPPVKSDEPSKPSERPMSVWMDMKMKYSEGILRGLASGDFVSIKTNAQQMHLLNRVEGFVRRRNPEYSVNLQIFERVTNELVRQADRENLDGVVLAFNQLTVSCVRCHQSLREQP